MKTSWQKTEGGSSEYIHVNEREVVRGHHSGSGHTDSAGCIPHKEFINGGYLKEIENTFGKKVAEEVLFAVENAVHHQPFIDKIEKVNKQWDYLMKFPQLESLINLLKHPETENGYSNYGNAGGYKTVVEGQNLILTAEKSTGNLTYKNPLPGKLEKNFTTRGHISSVVSLEDHFYLIHSDNFAEIGPEGDILFDTTKEYDDPEFLFGADLRLSRVVRFGGRIFVRWWWVSKGYPDGWLEYKSGQGFIGQCPDE